LEEKILGRLAFGQLVVDRYNSHLHPEVLLLLPEAFERIRLPGEQFMVVQVDFDRIVGNTTCVRTESGNQIVFAQRPKRFGLTRFVMNRKPEPCRSVVVILKKADNLADAFALVTAFIGVKPQPEPWDRNATEKSVEFWSDHALVWESEPIIPGTETDICPW
jgi:hypothetical protein